MSTLFFKKIKKIEVIFINLENIKNIGPKRLNIFHKMNIYSLEDLLTYYPYKYKSRNLSTTITKKIKKRGVFYKLRKYQENRT